MDSTHFINAHILKKYIEKGVYLTQPRLVAFYDCNYSNVTISKRIYYFRQQTFYPLDLNANFETYVPKDFQGRNDIDISLKYVMDSGALIRNIENIDKTKVITWRATLVRIMQSFHNKNSGDTVVCVSRYNGNLYMVLYESYNEIEESFLYISFPTEDMHHRCLRELSFSASLNEQTNIDDICNENIELIGVHRSNFGKFDLIYSGEIYGIISEEEFKEFDDLEALNRCRFVFTKQMRQSIRDKDNKYLIYWLESYLANVRDIYIGFKVEGLLHLPIEHFKTTDLTENRSWSPTMCTGFLYEFLQYVEKEMSSINCLDTVYKFQYNSKKNTIKYERFMGKSDLTFIKKNYKDYCKNN